MNRDVYLPLNEKKFADSVYEHQLHEPEDTYSRSAQRENKKLEMMKIFLSLATVFGVAPMSFVIFGILHAYLGMNLFLAAVSMMAVPIMFNHVLSNLILKEFHAKMSDLKNEMMKTGDK